MFKKLFGAMIALMIMMVFLRLSAQAAEYQRIAFTNAVSGSTSNSAAFYNAKILAVRALNLVPAITNAVTVTTAADGFTNTVATLSAITSASSVVATNNYLLLRGDVLSFSATSNATVMVEVENQSR